MRASRLIPVPPRTPETRSRDPHPLAPCAPARALRCALLQPSQTRTARAPRRPLGCWACPPPASLGFSCEPESAPRRGSPWPLRPLLVRPGPVSRLHLLHAPPTLRLQSPPASPREPGIRKSPFTPPTTPLRGRGFPARGVPSDPRTAPPLIS